MTTANQVLTEARKYLGVRVGSSAHHSIVDTYNAHKPLAIGYRVRYTDNWCDTFVSFIMIKLGATALTGTECGVERHVAVFEKLGIWKEDGRITPKPGDIIVYNWDDHSQPNDGFADHIGFVEKVSGGTITTIEGNKGTPGTVARRSISVGAGQIRGYARPRYAGASTTASSKPAGKTIDQLVADVLAGKYGSGDDRKKALGSKYAEVQAAVNAKLSGKKATASKPTSAGKLVKQSGTWEALTTVNVRSAPSLKGKVVAHYSKGQTARYDGYVDAEGIRWCSYIGASGKRRYVARRKLDGSATYAKAY